MTDLAMLIDSYSYLRSWRLTGRRRHRLAGLWNKKLVLQVEVETLDDGMVWRPQRSKSFDPPRLYWRDAKPEDFFNGEPYVTEQPTPPLPRR